LIGDISTRIAKDTQTIEKILESRKLQDAYNTLEKKQGKLNDLTVKYTKSIAEAATEQQKFLLVKEWEKKTKAYGRAIKKQQEFINENDKSLISQSKMTDFIKNNLSKIKVAVVAFIGYIINSMDQVRAKIVTTFGMAAPAVNKLTRAARGLFIETTHLGVSAEQVAESFFEIYKRVGILDVKRIEKLSKDSLKLSLAFDLSAEAASDLVIALERVGQTAEGFYKNVQLVANDFNVATGRIVKDLSDMNGEITAFNINKLQRASAIATKFSLSLKDMVDAMQKFSDLSSGIESTLKVNILTGSRLNAQYLYMANMMGDIEGATKHIVENLAQSNFEQLPPGLLRSVSSELGLSVDQINRMIDSYRRGTPYLNDTLKRQEQLNTLNDLAAQKMTTLAQLWARIKAIALTVLEPIAIGLSKIIDWLSQINIWSSKGVTAATVGFGLIGLAVLGLGLKLHLLGMKVIKSFLSMSASVKGFTASLLGSGVAMDKLNISAQRTGMRGGIGGSVFGKFRTTDMIKGAAALAILAGSLFITAKALKEFKDVNWDSMKKAGIAIVGLTAAVAALGAIMMSGVGTIAILAGAAAFAAIGVSLLMTGKGIQMISSFQPANIQALSLLPGTLLAIGVAALSAATGLTAYNLAAMASIPLLVTTSKLLGSKKVAMRGGGQGEIVNYDKMKESFKSALSEVDLKVKWDGKIESTPIIVSDREVGKIIHKIMDR